MANYSPSPSPRFVRASELAKLVGLGKSTIRRFSMDPDCPCVRPDGLRVVLFDVEEFTAWLRKGGPKGARERRAKAEAEANGTLQPNGRAK